MKKALKGPWVWIVVAVVAVLVALNFLVPDGGYDEVPTSQLESYIAEGQVDEITFIDGEQAIQATLDDGVRDEGEQVQSYYVVGQVEDIVAR